MHFIKNCPRGLLIFYTHTLIFVNLIGQYSSHIEKIDTCHYRIIVKPLNDTVEISRRIVGSVFKYRQADLDQDGTDDIILGVYKSTVLDSIKRNRINIYTLAENRIVPKWLGSFLPNPLYDFEIISINNQFYIVTTEYEENNLFLVTEYEWHSFGLKFIRYLKRNIDLNEALTLMKNPYETY